MGSSRLWNVDGDAGGIPGRKEVPGFEISSLFELFHQTDEQVSPHAHAELFLHGLEGGT